MSGPPGFCEKRLAEGIQAVKAEVTQGLNVGIVQVSAHWAWVWSLAFLAWSQLHHGGVGATYEISWVWSEGKAQDRSPFISVP